MYYAPVLLKKLFSARGLVAVLSVLIVGLVLLIVFVPEEQNEESRITNQESRADEIKTKLATLSQDSDNDGLKDWEEPLYKTDAQNQDTDGDGTNDGEEIKQNRDPLKKGADDKITELRKTASAETEPGPNLTAELMNVFIRGGVIEYLAQGGDPNALSEELYGNLRAIIGPPTFISPPLVSLSELNVITDSSEERLQHISMLWPRHPNNFLVNFPKTIWSCFRKFLRPKIWHDSRNLTGILTQ